VIKETQYERNPEFIYRRIVDESVLVPIHQDVANMDSIYTLNSIGAFIWENLAQPMTQTKLQNVIMAEYDADPEILSSDITRFLTEMTTIGALREV
jgi:hypothetical protein